MIYLSATPPSFPLEPTAAECAGRIGRFPIDMSDASTLNLLDSQTR